MGGWPFVQVYAPALGFLQSQILRRLYKGSSSETVCIIMPEHVKISRTRSRARVRVGWVMGITK